MSQLPTKFTLAALLFWFGAGAGSALTLGPADGGDLSPTDLERVQISSPAPDFTLEDEKGTPVSLSQFRGKKNVVLVFYRGHW
jgi:cytochrome oxidase Cu insertion factor (SCO1/SenC/PrrC family)